MNPLQRFLLLSVSLHAVALTVAGVLGWGGPAAVSINRGETQVNIISQEPVITVIPEEKLVKPIKVTKEKESVGAPAQIKEIKTDKSKAVQVIPSVLMEGIERSVVNYQSNPPPIYPRAAIVQNLQGEVVVWVEVSVVGEPLQVRVEHSSGHSILDDAAVRAVWKWKFSPASLCQVAIKSQVRIPIRFRIVQK